MDSRKKLILRIIIKEHIKTGLPVGSPVLAEKYNLNISSATIRNEMSELENKGYIVQPHTSAGRIPAEKAYNFYIENYFFKNKTKISKEDIKVFEKSLKNINEESLRKTAKILAKKSNNAVFLAFHRHNLYYTGISNLLSQPEFTQNNLIYDISVVIDKFDEIINKIYKNISDEPKILIGSKNPFGNFCSTVMTKYKYDDKVGLFGILGPIRMDYEKNLALIEFIYNKIKK